MFRSLLAAALLMLSGIAFAADGIGKLHHFRDWVVGCDNTLRCEAQGYGSERDDAPPGGRSALIIRRDAGPGQPPVLRFGYSTFDNAPVPTAGQAVRVQVGTLRFDMPTTAAQQQEPDVPASRVPALLAAAQKGNVILLSAGGAQWHVSLDGAAAALLKPSTPRTMATPISPRWSRPWTPSSKSRRVKLTTSCVFADGL